MRLIHRLIHLRHAISPDSVLNLGTEGTGAPVSKSVAADLRQSLHALQAEAFGVEQGGVNYARLGSSPAYTRYRGCAGRLRSFDLANLGSHEECMAFWINLYNALIIDAVIRFGIKRSVQELPGFFWRAAYEIGGQRYGSFDIEYGILRSNRGHPAIPGPQFGRGDPRLAFSLDRLDPRIHFALVCAARACPPIALYDAGSIESQLDLAARSFINQGGVELDRTRSEVRLSKIFQWYAPDFGARPLALGDKTPLLEYITGYLKDEDERDFVSHGNPRVRFMPYDWSLNGQAPRPTQTNNQPV